MSAPSGYLRFLDLPAAELELLRQRTREAAKEQASVQSGELTQVLEMRCHEQAFALPLESVEGITELVSMAAAPRVPPMVRGLVRFRGEILLGVELSGLVGEVRPGVVDLRRVVAVSAGGAKVAILAERVLSVLSVPVSSFRKDAVANIPFVVGTDENLLSLLDPAALVDHVVRLISGAA